MGIDARPYPECSEEYFCEYFSKKKEPQKSASHELAIMGSFIARNYLISCYGGYPPENLTLKTFIEDLVLDKTEKSYRKEFPELVKECKDFLSGDLDPEIFVERVLEYNKQLFGEE